MAVCYSIWPTAFVIKEILITADDGKNYRVNHYDLRVIIALGFKIDNEKAIAFRKWANQIVTEYTIKGWVMDDQRLKDGTPIADRYFDHLLEKIREIRLSERKFYQKGTGDSRPSQDGRESNSQEILVSPPPAQRTGM